MGKSYKNFWSLQTDEAVVTGILRDVMHSNTEVFMPINAQMKDIDLLLYNQDNKKTLTIQVKGSKAYEPSLSDIEKYGGGSCGWFFLTEKSIINSIADFYIFLVYVINQPERTGRRSIEPHTLTIPTKDLIRLSKKYKKTHKGKSGARFSYYFWITPSANKAYDIRDKKNVYELEKYLNKSGFDLLHKKIL